MKPWRDSDIEVWEWVVTAVVIILLILIGIWAFGGRNEQSVSESKDTLMQNVQKCFDSGGYIQTQLLEFRSVDDVNTLHCYTDKSLN